MNKTLERINSPMFDDVREFLPEVIQAMREPCDKDRHFMILVALKRASQKGFSEATSQMEAYLNR